MSSLISEILLAAKSYVSFASIKSEKSIYFLSKMVALIYSDIAIFKNGKNGKMVFNKKKNAFSPVWVYGIRVRVLHDTPMQHR
jgi:hypothetical protein